MVLDWKTAEAKERLLASVLASLLPAKLDYAKVAKMYGQGATYNSVEKQFRVLRKTADQLYQEAEDGAPSTTPSKTTKKGSSSKKDTSPGSKGVVDGKVKKTKAKSAAPKKLPKAAKLEEYIQFEELQNGHKDNFDDLDDDEHDTFDSGNYGISVEELYDDEP